jgi:hypothetical protein
MLDGFLLKLFDKYAELLKRRFSDDFQEAREDHFILNWLGTDFARSFLPTTTCLCLSATWTSTIKLLTSVGSHQRSQERNSRQCPNQDDCFTYWLACRFPCVLPFSQMYPLCCIDIRNFLNQFYFFADDHFQHSNVIDETLKKVKCNHSKAMLITNVTTSR